MSLPFRTEQRVNASADRVLELMLDPASQEALLKSLGTLEVKATVTRTGEGRARVHLVTADPGMPGVAVHRAEMDMDWDLPNRACTWVRTDLTLGDRVRAWGTTRVLPAGESACTVVESGEIDVRVPVMGGAIARKVVDKMVEQAPRKAAFWASKKG